jgi:hypothetical protein
LQQVLNDFLGAHFDSLQRRQEQFKS